MTDEEAVVQEQVKKDTAQAQQEYRSAARFARMRLTVLECLMWPALAGGMVLLAVPNLEQGAVRGALLLAFGAAVFYLGENTRRQLRWDERAAGYMAGATVHLERLSKAARDSVLQGAEERVLQMDDDGEKVN
jgi:hypothetical protein